MSIISRVDSDERLGSIPSRILRELEKVVIGKKHLLESIIVALLSEGHVLIEGYPGTAKTLVAKALAKVIQGKFKRIQFTPDVLPTDITGYYIYTLQGESIFRPGPIFANIVVADELNRATPRTQAALLEAMQEKQVTIDGITHKLPEPFMVIATQIPLGLGTGIYPLAEVQIDRFMLRIWSDYPSIEEEVEVISKVDYIEELPLDSVTTVEEIMMLTKYIKNTVYVNKNIMLYITNIVNYLRRHPYVSLGPSPRASISLYKAARTYAFLNKRDYVVPDDVKRFAHEALDHRIRLKPEAELENIKPEDLVEEALKEIEPPKPR